MFRAYFVAVLRGYFRYILIFAVVLPAIWLFNQYDLYANYQLTDARVSYAFTECALNATEISLDVKSVALLTHMNCENAPALLQKYGYKASDVNVLKTVKLVFTSPADGKIHEIEKVFKGIDKDSFDLGQQLQIYANLSSPNAIQMK